MQSEIFPKKLIPEVIDVCRYGVVECIKCDVPCSEGYGPENLTTINFIERSKGFLAERFIKPPVTLVLDFKNEVDINYISVNCKVGAQKTTGIELFSKSVKSDYESVASGVLPDDKNGFVFYKFSEKVKDKFGDEFHFRTFRPKSTWILSSVKSLKIKIFRTSGVSVPGLGKIEVWGILRKMSTKYESNKTGSAVFTTTTLSKEINPLKLGVCLKDSQRITQNRQRLQCATVKKFDSTDLLTNQIMEINEVKLNETLTIPDDFIDPITCELMIQPVTLPCGKVIDISTLDLHNKAELNWGRCPNDPFTGVQFSDVSKPIAASDLKARIDKFLSYNCNNTKLYNIPRTLGSKQLPQLVSAQKGKTKVNVSKLISESAPHQENCIAINTPGDCRATMKRKTSETSLEPIDIFVKDSLPSSSNSKDILTLSSKKPKFSSFEDRLKQSLELSLKSTLSKLPKFTADKEDLIKHITANCQNCKSTDNLFGLPCNHFICRLCLVVSKSKMLKLCSLCNLEYKASDVQKIHIS